MTPLDAQVQPVVSKFSDGEQSCTRVALGTPADGIKYSCEDLKTQSGFAGNNSCSGSSEPPEPGTDWLDVTEAINAVLREVSPDELIYNGKSFQWARCVSAVELTLPNLDRGAGIPLGKTYADSVKEGNVPDSVQELFNPERGSTLPAQAITENLFISTINWADGRRPFSEIILPSMHVYKALFLEETLGTALTVFAVEACLFVIKRVRSLLLSTNIHFEEDICVKLQMPPTIARKITAESLVNATRARADTDLLRSIALLHKSATDEVDRACNEHGLSDTHHDRLIGGLNCWWHLCAFLEAVIESALPLNTLAHTLKSCLSHHIDMEVDDSPQNRTVGFDLAVVRYLLPASPPNRIPLMGLQEVYMATFEWANFSTQVQKAFQFCVRNFHVNSELHFEEMVCYWLDFGCICTTVSASLNPGIVVRTMLCRMTLEKMRSFLQFHGEKPILQEETTRDEYREPDSGVKPEIEALFPIADSFIRVLCMNRGRQRRRLPRVIRRLARSIATRQALESAIQCGAWSELTMTSDQEHLSHINSFDWARTLIVLRALLRVLDLGDELRLYSAIERRFLQAIELLLLRSLAKISDVKRNTSCRHISDIFLRARLALCEAESVWNAIIRYNKGTVPTMFSTSNSGDDVSAACFEDEKTSNDELVHDGEGYAHLCPNECAALSEAEIAAFESRFRAVLDVVPVRLDHVNVVLREREIANLRNVLERGISEIQNFFILMQDESIIALQKEQGIFTRSILLLFDRAWRVRTALQQFHQSLFTE
jgi:hypothetical protein